MDDGAPTGPSASERARHDPVAETLEVTRVHRLLERVLLFAGIGARIRRRCTRHALGLGLVARLARRRMVVGAGLGDEARIDHNDVRQPALLRFLEVLASSRRYHHVAMALPALHLSRTSVFLDFDGTVSTADVGVHLLERFGSQEWRALDEQYGAGLIGSRECLGDEWELIDGSEAALRAAAREVPLDPGFGDLVRSLQAAGAEVTVVSDGFGFYVEEACAPVGVDVLTNAVDFDAGELGFPHENWCCPCSTCGMCKQAPIKDARHRGMTTVLVGDGISDRKAALLADVVFAKDQLRDWCERAGVAHRRFDDLDEVRAALLGS